MCKMFADDTSLFSKVLDVNKSVVELNADLGKDQPMGLSMENAIEP